MQKYYHSLVYQSMKVFETMDKLREILAQNIKNLRHESGLSQEELADLCGLHRTYISDVERANRNVSIDNIERIADALNVTPADLLKDSE